jgi:hypothetical protein
VVRPVETQSCERYPQQLPRLIMDFDVDQDLSKLQQAGNKRRVRPVSFFNCRTSHNGDESLGLQTCLPLVMLSHAVQTCENVDLMGRRPVARFLR